MINSERIYNIFIDCLFKDEEMADGKPRGECTIGEGVMTSAGFHPGRLESYKDEIIGFLEQLPDSFKKSGGGGMSFLNMCIDKEGHHWGEHPSCDRLIALGNAIGKIEFTLPREVWGSLPGGVPYLTIDL